MLFLEDAPQGDISKGPTATASELYSASRDEQLYAQGSIMNFKAVRKGWEDKLNHIEKVTGQRMAVPQFDGVFMPQWGGLNDDDMQQHKEHAAAEYIRTLSRIDELASQYPQYAEKWLTHPEAAGHEVSRTADKQLKDVTGRNQSWLGSAAGFAGAFVGGMQDPINLGLAPFGAGKAVGQGAYNVLKAGVVNGLIGAAGEAAIQPMSQQWRREAGLKYGLGEAAKNVGFAFAFGFGIDAGIRGAYRGGKILKGKIDGKPNQAQADAFYNGLKGLDEAGSEAQVHDIIERAASHLPANNPLHKALIGKDYKSLVEAVRTVDPERAEGLAQSRGDLGHDTADIVDDELRGAANWLQGEDGRPELAGVHHTDDVAAEAQASRHIADQDEPPAVMPKQQPESGASLQDGAVQPLADSGEINGKAYSSQKVRPSSIETDAKAFQFKEGGDSAGVTQRLEGIKNWNPMASGKAIVFQRKNGALIIADGHQRLGLAKKLEHQDDIKLDAFIFQESDGWTPAQVRALAAKKNIQEATGSALDYARIMRDQPALLDGSVPQNSTKMEHAKGLANLSEDAFGLVINEIVPANHAALVGRLVNDKALHVDLLDQMAKADLASEAQARIFIGQALQSGTHEITQMTLFGTETTKLSLLPARTKILTDALKNFKQNKRLLAAINANADKVEAVGNTVNKAANEKQSAQSAQMAELIEKLASSHGPVSDALQRAAHAMAHDDISVTKSRKIFMDDVDELYQQQGLEGLINPQKIDEPHIEPGSPEAEKQGDLLGQNLKKTDIEPVDVKTKSLEGYSEIIANKLGSIIFQGRGAEGLKEFREIFNEPIRDGYSYGRPNIDTHPAEALIDSFNNLRNPLGPEYIQADLDVVKKAAIMLKDTVPSLNQLIKSFEEFQKGDTPKDFSAIVERLPEPVRAELVKAVDLPPEAAKSVEAGQVTALWDRGRKLIQVAMHNADPAAKLRHEEIHALRDLELFTAPEWKMLLDAGQKAGIMSEKINGEMSRHDLYSQAYANRSDLAELMDQEVVAHLAERRKAGQDFGVQANAVLDKLLEFLHKTANALRGMGFQTAEDVFNRIESGEIGRRAGKTQEIADKAVMNNADLAYSLDVYHGTPHEFDRFDYSKIGTGEGNQAYGHGIYFAEDSNIADWYVSQLSNPIIENQAEIDAAITASTNLFNRYFKEVPGVKNIGELLQNIVSYDKNFDIENYLSSKDSFQDHEITSIFADFFNKNNKNQRSLLNKYDALKDKNSQHKFGTDEYKETSKKMNEAYSNLAKELSDNIVGLSGSVTNNIIKKMGSLIKENDIPKLTPKILTKNNRPQYHGNRYHVSLNISKKELLHFDESLGSHPRKIKAVIKNVAEDNGVNYSKKMTGEEFYYNLATAKKSEAVASEVLREAGIPALRFLDSNSRSALMKQKSKNYNIVLFDDNLAEISAVNSKAIPEGGRKTAAQIKQEAAVYANRRFNKTKRFWQNKRAETTIQDRTGSVAYSISEEDALKRVREIMGEADEALGKQSKQETEPDYDLDALLEQLKAEKQREHDAAHEARMTDIKAKEASDAEKFDAEKQREAAEKSSAAEVEIAEKIAQLEAQKAARKAEREQAKAEEQAAIAEQTAEEQSAKRKEYIEQKRRAVLTLVAAERIKADMLRHKNAKGQHDVVAAALSHMENYGTAKHSAIAQREKEILGEALAQMHEFALEFERTKITGQTPKAKMGLLNDIIRESFGEKTGNTDAQRMAGAWYGAHESMRLRFNRSGGMIGYLKNWGLPQSHNQMAIEKAKFTPWKEFITPLLDREKMRHNITGLPHTDEQFDDMLVHIYQTIVTNGMNTKEPSMGGGVGGALYKQGSEARFLHFKNADSWLEYAQKFGNVSGTHGTDLGFHAMMSHLSGFSRDVAAMEILGPNPNAMLNYMKGIIESQLAMSQLFKGGALPADGKDKQGNPYVKTLLGRKMSHDDYVRKGLKKLEDHFDIVRGVLDSPVDAQIADYGKTIRNWQVATKLGSATLSAIGDLATFKAALKFAGMKNEQMIIKDIFKYIQAEDRHFAVRSGLILDSAMSMVHTETRFGGAVEAATRTGKIADRTLAWSGLSAWTQGIKHAFGMESMANFARVRDLSFDKLEPNMQRLFQNYGLTAQQWDLIRAVQPTEHKGVAFLRGVDMVGDADLMAVKTKYMEMIHAETEYAVPSGTIGSQAITKKFRAGTVEGETWRLFFQFKAYPISILMMQGGRTMRLVHGEGRAAGAAYATSTFLAMTLAGGVVGTWLKDLKAGRDPDMDFTSQKNWGRWMAQGGGIGIMGDFLFSDHNRFGSGPLSTFAGPAFGDVERVLRATAGNAQKVISGKETSFAKDALGIVRSNTPGIGSLWYTATAYNRVLLDQMNHLIDPAASKSFKRRMNKRKRDFGQEYFWPLGETTPNRAPSIAGL